MQGALWSAHRVHVHPRCGREGVEADKDLATRPEAEVQALGDLSVSAGNGEGSTGDAKASTEAETAGGGEVAAEESAPPAEVAAGEGVEGPAAQGGAAAAAEEDGAGQPKKRTAADAGLGDPSSAPDQP